jgi:hypothetical protein
MLYFSTNIFPQNIKTVQLILNKNMAPMDLINLQKINITLKYFT